MSGSTPAGGFCLVGRAAPLLLALAAWAAPAVGQDGLAAAQRLRQAGRVEEALVEIDAALERDRDDPELLGFRGLLLLDAGRREEAAALASRMADYDGEAFRVHVFLGRWQQASGQGKAAVASFRRALEERPQAVEPAVGLVQALCSLGRFPPAVTAAEQLEVRQPELGRRLAIDALMMEAQTYRTSGDETAGLAIGSYQRALEKDPENQLIARALIDTLIDFIRVDQARELIEVHYAGERDRAERHFLRGRCHAALTEGEAARTEFETALESDASHAASLIELARLDLDESQPERALEHLDRAAAAGAPTARSLLLRGMAEEALGRDGPAETAFRRALELEPDHPKVLFQLGRLLVRTGRAEEGLPLIQRSVERNG
jgi:tetratricopeptide (TPR) repeat protein